MRARPLVKILALAAVLVATAPALTAAQLCGDADGDDAITDTDAVLILRAAGALSSSCTTTLCDLDGSNALTETDGVNALRLAAGLAAETGCPTGIAGFVGSVADDAGAPGLLQLGAAPIPGGGAPVTISNVAGDTTVTAGETSEVTVTHAAGASAAVTADPALVVSLRDANGVRVDGFFEVPVPAATGTTTLTIAFADELGGGTFFLDFATFAAGTLSQYAAIPQTPAAPVIAQILSATGDGTNALDDPDGIAVDRNGTVYVVGEESCNVFRITSAGAISEVLNASDLGDPNTPCVQHLDVSPTTDAAYIGTNNGVFRVPPDGGTQVYDTAGDPRFTRIFSVDADDNGNIFATGDSGTHNVVCLPGGQGPAVNALGAAGDGVNPFTNPGHLAVGGSGNATLFASGLVSRNVFRIVNPCSGQPQVTQIFTTTLDIDDLGADPAGNAYVTFQDTDSVIQVSPSGAVKELIDGSGDSALLDDADELAVDAKGTVYVVGEDSNNAFRITSPGTAKQTIQQIIDGTGDGSNPFLEPENVAVDRAGTTVYVSGEDSDNVFEIELP